MRPGFMLANAQLPQRRDPRAASSPALPDTHPDAAANPRVQFSKEALDGHETEVPYPALEITTKFGTSLCKRDTATASGEVPDAGGELVEVLPGDAKLAAVALEDEAGVRSVLRWRVGAKPNTSPILQHPELATNNW